jgi:hypothetical protein
MTLLLCKRTRTGCSALSRRHRHVSPPGATQVERGQGRRGLVQACGAHDFFCNSYAPQEQNSISARKAKLRLDDSDSDDDQSTRQKHLAAIERRKVAGLSGHAWLFVLGVDLHRC